MSVCDTRGQPAVVTGSKLNGATYRVRRLCSDVGHDGHDNMLLDCERARIEGEAEDGDAGTYSSHESTEGE